MQPDNTKKLHQLTNELIIEVDTFIKAIKENAPHEVRNKIKLKIKALEQKIVRLRSGE